MVYALSGALQTFRASYWTCVQVHINRPTAMLWYGLRSRNLLVENLIAIFGIPPAAPPGTSGFLPA